MNLFKRIIPFFLLLIIVLISAQFILFTSYIHVQHSEFRKATLRDSSLRVRHILISENNLYKNINGYEWEEENKELIIKGLHYEIISIKKTKKSIVVSIIADEIENGLFEKVLADNASDINDVLILLLNLDFLTPEIDLGVAHADLKSTYNNNLNSFEESSYHLQLIKPPRAI